MRIVRRDWGRYELRSLAVGAVAVLATAVLVALTPVDPRLRQPAERGVLDERGYAAASLPVDPPSPFGAIDTTAHQSATVAHPAGQSVRVVASGGIRGPSGSTARQREVSFSSRALTVATEGGQLVEFTAANWPRENILEVGPRGAYIVARRYEECRFDQPLLRWPAHLEVGQAWRGASACRLGGLRIEMRLESTVIGTRPIVVEGESYLGYVIEARTEVREDHSQRGELRRADHELLLIVPELGGPVALHRSMTIAVRGSDGETVVRRLTLEFAPDQSEPEPERDSEKEKGT